MRIWNKLQGIFITKWESKNVQYQLENVSFSNMLTFTLIVLVSQTTNVKEWKSWFSCFWQLHWGSISIVVIGVAFSLIVIMLQTKCFVTAHSLVVSNILIEKIQKCDHINNFFISILGLILLRIVLESEQICALGTRLCGLKKCVFTLLHMRHCCPLSSVCVQNLKSYVSLSIKQFLTDLKNNYRLYGADI